MSAKLPNPVETFCGAAREAQVGPVSHDLVSSQNGPLYRSTPAHRHSGDDDEERQASSTPLIKDGGNGSSKDAAGQQQSLPRSALACLVQACKRVLAWHRRSAREPSN